MTLSDYITRKHLSGSDVAAALRVSRAAVSRYLSGDRLPADDIMRRIAEWSGGRVTANDFYGIGRRGGR